MSYQTITGTLNPGAHPGSYNGQDAYNDLLITDGNYRNKSQLYAYGGDNGRNDSIAMCNGSQRPANGNRGRGGYEMDTVVRRLTPLECERLQGFPDGWTDIGEWTDTKGRLHKDADTPRYKALGNSIALPFWFYLLRRISAQYERPATLGSLFDGIGGFPLCWIRCNGTGSVLWSSEIEEFPIAVLKKHFGDGNTEGDVREYL